MYLIIFLFRYLIFPIFCTATQIKIDNLNDNPGILPFNLGHAKIHHFDRTFIFFIDLLPLKDELMTLEKFYNTLNQIKLQDNAHLKDDHSVSSSIKHVISYETDSLDKTLLYLLTNTHDKLNHLIPNLRQKRGIIDGLGSLIKVITGNLDHTDAERYDKILNTLQQNQNKIIKNSNEEISLEENLIRKFNQTLFDVTKNQNLLEIKLQNLTRSINQHTINIIQIELINHLQILNSLLSDLENTITFARLEILSQSLLKPIEIFNILSKMHKDFDLSQMVLPLDEPNILNYYKIIKLYSYYSDYKLNFIISIPIVFHDIYTYYHLYSIPINNYTIVPRKRYFLSNNNQYIYSDKLCINLNSIYYCNFNGYFENSKSDCIYQIIHATIPTEKCNILSITIPTTIIEKITTSQYLIIFPKETKIKLNCSYENYQIFKGVYLFTIPKTCSIITENIIITNSQELSNLVQPILLPNIQLNKNQNDIINELPINLININLDSLQKFQHSFHQIKLSNHLIPIKQKSYINQILLIFFILLLICFILYYLIIKYKFLIFKRRSQSCPLDPLAMSL